MISMIIVLLVISTSSSYIYKNSTNFGLLRCIGLGVMTSPAVAIRLIGSGIQLGVALLDVGLTKLGYALMGTSQYEIALEVARKELGDSFDSDLEIVDEVLKKVTDKEKEK